MVVGGRKDIPWHDYCISKLCKFVSGDPSRYQFQCLQSSLFQKAGLISSAKTCHISCFTQRQWKVPVGEKVFHPDHSSHPYDPPSPHLLLHPSVIGCSPASYPMLFRLCWMSHLLSSSDRLPGHQHPILVDLVVCIARGRTDVAARL